MPLLMVEACRSIYTSREDARFLAAVVGGLESAEVRTLLPALLKLPAEQWPAIKHRLLRPRSHLDGMCDRRPRSSIMHTTYTSASMSVCIQHVHEDRHTLCSMFDQEKACLPRLSFLWRCWVSTRAPTESP